MAINEWTAEQRITLHLLNSHFTYPPATAAAIFNRMFADHLSTHGFPNGLEASVLGSQYRERKRTGTRGKAWKVALSALRADGELKATLLERIEEAATARGAVSTSDDNASALAQMNEAVLEPEEGEGSERDDPLAGGEEVVVDQLPESELQMIHSSKIRWNHSTNTGTIPSLTGLSIDPDSTTGNGEVYFHGGQVYRIRTTNTSHKVDVMVCDTTFCLLCNEDADDEQVSRTDGSPFVHSSETIRDERGITTFTPLQRKRSGAITKGYRRRVRFLGIDGETVACQARLCGLKGCGVCEALSDREHVNTRVENGVENDEDAKEDHHQGEEVVDKGKGKSLLMSEEIVATTAFMDRQPGEGNGGLDIEVREDEPSEQAPRLRLILQVPKVSGKRQASKKRE